MFCSFSVAIRRKDMLCCYLSVRCKRCLSQTRQQQAYCWPCLIQKATDPTQTPAPAAPHASPEDLPVVAAERDEELEGVEDDGPLGDGGEAEPAGLQQPRVASVGALPSASAPRVLGTATTTGLGVFGHSGMPPLNNPFSMNTAGAQMGNIGAPMGLAGAMGMPALVSYHQMAGQLTSPSPPAVRRRAGRSPGGNSKARRTQVDSAQLWRRASMRLSRHLGQWWRI